MTEPELIHRLGIGAAVAAVALTLAFHWVRRRHTDPDHPARMLARMGLWVYAGGCLIWLACLAAKVSNPHNPLGVHFGAGLFLFAGASMIVYGAFSSLLAGADPDAPARLQIELNPRVAGLEVRPASSRAEECPFCHAGFTDADARVACARCGADYHRACVEELGDRCAALGCRAKLSA